MARTSLAAALKSQIKELLNAESTNTPVDVIRHERSQRLAEAIAAPNRRQVISAGSAALAAALFAKGAEAQTTNASIAVIGGGIAGLTCALDLVDRGFSPTVFEASSRLGGRIYSNTSTWAGGQTSEWGGELIDTGHETMLALAQRFNLQLSDLPAAAPAGSDDVYRINGKYYDKKQADADFKALVPKLKRDLRAAPYPTSFDNHTAGALELDSMSVYQWIESRVPGGHSSALGELLDIAYTVEYACDSRTQSALNIVYLLGYQPDPTKLTMLGESDERFRVVGGNQRVPRAIAAHLGSRVKTGHQLLKLKRTTAGRSLLTFNANGQTKEMTFDYVVMTIPFAALNKLNISQAGFDELKLEAIREQGRGMTSKLQLQFDRREWRGAGPWKGLSNGSTYADSGYQCSWEVTRGQAGTPGILSLFGGGSVVKNVNTTAAFGTIATAGVRADAERGLNQISKVYPGLDWNGRATQSLWHKSSLFGLSYAVYKVGQYTSIAGYEAVRQGNVLFAGEHTSSNYPGYMEGGAETGMRASKELRKLIRGA